MLCFSTTLLLAAMCLLVSADVPTEIVTTCGSQVVHRLSCDTGVISVQTALYGHVNSVTCSSGDRPQEVSNTDCSLVSVADEVKKRCGGKKVCELSSNVFASPDPCSDTMKYLQTKYTCVPAIYRVTCEHSLAHLQCDEGQVLLVHAADYGRHDRTTCSYRRPDIEIRNTDCSRPNTKVAESCNGKNSCIIKADNSVFGDPCYGTYKYLEVAYTCQAAEVTSVTSKYGIGVPFY